MNYKFKVSYASPKHTNQNVIKIGPSVWKEWNLVSWVYLGPHLNIPKIILKSAQQCEKHFNVTATPPIQTNYKFILSLGPLKYTHKFHENGPNQMNYLITRPQRLLLDISLNNAVLGHNPTQAHTKFHQNRINRFGEVQWQTHRQYNFIYKDILNIRSY